MKVAIIGNMNNAGFCIMRYLRDLGFDAHLLLYKTDGAQNLSHFSPQADTWQFDHWRPYIHQTQIANHASTLIGSIRSWALPMSRSSLRRELLGYDRYIGSGLAPAICKRADINLDIFFPYGTGIEFYGTLELQSSRRRSRLRRIFLNRLRNIQAEGILSTSFCLNAELSLTRKSFDEIGKPFINCFLPAVYNKEPRPAAAPESIQPLIDEIRSRRFAVFSHARQLWVRKSEFDEVEWRSQTKNSDYLIRGFAEFLARQTDSESLLVLLEYGEDVSSSKYLCKDLGIEEHVRWVSKTERRNLMLLLSECNVGVGEFYLDPGVIWGGTGWEVLAARKPLLQSFNFQTSEFEDLFGVPCPPIFHCNSPTSVAEALTTLYHDLDRAETIGRESLSWFDSHGGIGLASKWSQFLGQENFQESHKEPILTCGVGYQPK